MAFPKKDSAKKDTTKPATAKPATRKPAAAEPAESVQGIQSDTVLVANQHSGPIILPRVAVQGEQRIQLAPTILHPGTVTPVSREVWEEHKKITVIQHYLDKHLLAEVNRTGAVPVMDATSTDLEDCIPDNLKTEEELGNIEGVSAKVKITGAGSTTL